MDKTYLGDSVYIKQGNYVGEFILTTENNEPTDPSNEICIDLNILDALNLFVKKSLEEKK